MSNEYTQAKTVVPPKIGKVTPVSKFDDNSVKNNIENKTVKVKAKLVKVTSNIYPVTTPKPSGPNMFGYQSLLNHYVFEGKVRSLICAWIVWFAVLGFGVHEQGAEDVNGATVAQVANGEDNWSNMKASRFTSRNILGQPVPQGHIVGVLFYIFL
ncbi:hypothetical protein AgCh_021851 [Apium graveolens]